MVPKKEITIAAIREKRSRIKVNENEPYNWGMIDSDASSYSDAFGPLLQRCPIYAHFDDAFQIENAIVALKIYKQQRLGRIPRVADIMSYGSVLEDLDVPGVAIGLTDRRTSKQVTSDMQSDRQFIPGDILKASTWVQMNRYVEEHGQFDIIMCRPVAGISKIPAHELVQASLFARFYDVLSTDSGTLFTEFRHGVEQYVDSLNEITGIYADATIGGDFMLLRSPDAPATSRELFAQMSTYTGNIPA